MKVIITGGCGFVGSHFIEHILKTTDWDIVTFDKLTYAASGLDRVRDINAFDDKRVTFFSVDFTREISEGVVQECKDANYILHLGAESITEDTFLPVYFPHGGTKVMTFGELWNQKSRYSNVEKTDKGEKIRVNDSSKALSFYNGGQWCKIKYITRHKYNGKIIRLLQKNAILEATPNHSIYSANLELTNPEKNPDLLVIRNINEFGKVYKNVSVDLLKFLASYITEGSISKNKSNGCYSVVIPQNNIDWLYDINESASKIGYNNGYITIREGGCSQLSFSNKELYKFLERECGKGSMNKKIPDWVFDLEPELREYFWNCLLEGDGNIDDKGNHRYTTTSPRLAAQIGLLLSLQNKIFTVNERKFDKEEWNTCWNFRVNIKSNSQINTGNKKIEEIEYDGWVYDLEVEDSHNFVCGIGNAVCHNTHVDNSIDDPKPFVYSNFVGTYNMLEFARKCEDLKAFVYFSTDEVFGPAPEGVDYKEWDRYNSTNPYSATKAGGEELVLAYMNTYGVRGFITHCMNIFGERQHPEKFIPLCIRKIEKGETVMIHGTPDKTKSGSRFYIHARNVASAVHFLLDKFEQREKYNIVGEKELTNLELAQRIADAMGMELKYEIVDFHSSRPGHDLRYSLCGEKMKGMGWNVPVTIDETIKNVVKWTLKNRKWIGE